MAFVVEDGTGVPGANAYASVAFVDGYFADRGVTAWTGDQATKEAKIIAATDYIDVRFGHLFNGLPDADDQALAWPRDIYDGMPEALKKATAEYALRAISGPLAPDPTVEASGAVVARRRVKVGPIEKEIQYAGAFGDVTVFNFRPYPAVDSLLRPFLNLGLRTQRV